MADSHDDVKWSSAMLGYIQSVTIYSLRKHWVKELCDTTRSGRLYIWWIWALWSCEWLKTVTEDLNRPSTAVTRPVETLGVKVLLPLLLFSFIYLSLSPPLCFYLSVSLIVSLCLSSSSSSSSSGSRSVSLCQVNILQRDPAASPYAIFICWQVCALQSLPHLLPWRCSCDYRTVSIRCQVAEGSPCSPLNAFSGISSLAIRSRAPLIFFEEEEKKEKRGKKKHSCDPGCRGREVQELTEGRKERKGEFALFHSLQCSRGSVGKLAGPSRKRRKQLRCFSHGAGVWVKQESWSSFIYS